MYWFRVAWKTKVNLLKKIYTGSAVNFLIFESFC